MSTDASFLSSRGNTRDLPCAGRTCKQITVGEDCRLYKAMWCSATTVGPWASSSHPTVGKVSYGHSPPGQYYSIDEQALQLIAKISTLTSSVCPV